MSLEVTVVVDPQAHLPGTRPRQPGGRDPTTSGSQGDPPCLPVFVVLRIVYSRLVYDEFSMDN